MYKSPESATGAGAEEPLRVDSILVTLNLRMRLAVLSDIHGNVLALEAVIRDLAATLPDAVVNLGDHLSGPLWPSETADLLMAHTGWLHIRGNHDRQMSEQRPEVMGKSDWAAYQRLERHQLEWLASRPAEARLERDVFACHGTPSNDCEYLLEDVSLGFVRIIGRGELRSALGVLTGTILCGHSHIPRLARVDQSTVVANPGSVGLQAYYDAEHRHPHVIETGTPHTRYLLMDRRRNSWDMTWRALEYDWECAARRADTGQRPDWGHALRTGYALSPAMSCSIATTPR